MVHFYIRNKSFLFFYSSNWLRFLLFHIIWQQFRIRIQEQGIEQINLISNLSKWLFCTYTRNVGTRVFITLTPLILFFTSKFNFLWRQSPTRIRIQIPIDLATWIRIRICIEIKKSWIRIRIRIETNADPHHGYLAGLCYSTPRMNNTEWSFKKMFFSTWWCLGWRRASSACCSGRCPCTCPPPAPSPSSGPAPGVRSRPRSRYPPSGPSPSPALSCPKKHRKIIEIMTQENWGYIVNHVNLVKFQRQN